MSGQALIISRCQLGFEFVDTREQADVALLWLTPNVGSLFGNTGAEIELQLSKSKINVDHVNETMAQKPTIMVVNYTNPWVIDEVDNANAKTIVATFNTTAEALLDVVSGKFKPTGKMPFSTPRSREAVLNNKSDVPGDLEPGYSLFKFGAGIGYEK